MKFNRTKDKRRKKEQSLQKARSKKSKAKLTEIVELILKK